jgi:uncharacterized protein (DUF1697 family)
VTKWVAFLRAINLGSTNKVPMAELRELMTGMGYGDVRTFLQSGNATFASEKRKATQLEEEFAAALTERFGFAIPVMVRSADDLSAVVDGNPFPGSPGIEPKQLHVAFLSVDPSAAHLEALDATAYEPDEFALGDRVVYLRLPDGVQGSRLPAAMEKALGVRSTMRTWNTVTRLLALATD